jgi:hypothetical protein
VGGNRSQVRLWRALEKLKHGSKSEAGLLSFTLPSSEKGLAPFTLDGGSAGRHDRLDKFRVRVHFFVLPVSENGLVVMAG